MEKLKDIKKSNDIVKLFSSLIGIPEMKVSVNINFEGYGDLQKKIFNQLLDNAMKYYITGGEEYERLEIILKSFCKSLGLEITAENQRRIEENLISLSQMKIAFEYVIDKGEKGKAWFPLFIITSRTHIDKVSELVSIVFSSWRFIENYISE